MPANSKLHVRTPQPHLELLRRRKEEEATAAMKQIGEGKRSRTAVEEEQQGRERRIGDDGIHSRRRTEKNDDGGEWIGIDGRPIVGSLEPRIME